MAYKEIVTKAVIGKGKKKYKDSYKIEVSDKPSTILGCWIINHNFSGKKINDKVIIDGSFDVNIWYSYDNDTKTNVLNKKISYSNEEKINLGDKEVINEEIIVRSLKQPTCISAKENGNEIENNNDINEEYTTQTHSPIKKTLFFLAGLLFLCLLFGASWYYWPMITKKILDTTSRKEYILCPELVNVAKRINDNAPMKDTNGYTVISATYKDDLFIYRFIVDDSLELYSKIAKHLPEFKENLIIGIQLSTGEERDRYYDFAEYGVTIKSIFECKVSKETYSFSVSPEEISDALNTDITPYDRIKHLTKTQQKGLPSAIMEGVIVQEITIEEDHIYMKIGIDESDIDFEMLTNNKNEFGEDWIGWFSEQNKFYLSLVADADMGVYFYFYGMVTHYNMTIELSPKEVKLLTLK